VNKTIFVCAVTCLSFVPAVHANPMSRRATITGSGGNGRCTIEVSVDHAAEVEISGDNGLLTTVAGQPAAWRRFQCNAPLPRNPPDFRFVKINGRGTVRLLQDPRNTGGRAVIHVSDPQGGRGNYTFDLQWGGRNGGGWNGGGWTPGPPDPRPGHGPNPGGFPTARAIQVCQNSVTDRLNQRAYSSVRFWRTASDNNSGRHNWISGTASAIRGHETTWFSFSCSVDSYSGRVHSVDVRRR
jgi:hypothetical protein